MAMDTEKIFETEVAAENFKRLAMEYFNGNFGKMRKSDVELFMFSAYFDALVGEMIAKKNNATTDKDKNKAVDEFMKKTSDTALAVTLGVLPSTIRNLKHKKSLVDSYNNAEIPKAYDWRIFFNKIKKTITFIEKENMVRINVADAMLLQEISNFLEQNKGYVELELTPNLIKVTPEDFIKLAVETEADEEKRKLLHEKLKKFAESHNKEFDELTKTDSRYETIMDYLLSEKAEACLDLLSLLPTVGCVGSGIKGILNVLRKHKEDR